MIVVSDDEATAGTISPLVSPAKRVRTPSSKHRNQDHDHIGAGNPDAGGLDEAKDELELGRTTRLFAEGNSDADVEEGSSGSSKERTKEDDEAPPALFATPQKPKNQKTFGTPSSIQCSSSVKNAYSIVRRCTGSLGGNGSGGAIYGELTTGSMQKVVDVMISHCGLGKDSIFIDVGAGLGKPNIHVAQYPGVAASYGIEHEQVRWQLSLHNLKHLLQAAEAEAQEAAETAAAAVEAEVDAEAAAAAAVVAAADRINHKIFFHYGDVTEARRLDPFTHVYMFDIGFPPALFYEIADRFNASHCPFLICYHGPKLIAERYGFDVSLLTQIQTSMHGSSEGHTAYFYKRANPLPAPPARRPVDALFKQGLDLIGQSSLENLHSWVKQKMDSHFTSPRPARQRRSTNLFDN